MADETDRLRKLRQLQAEQAAAAEAKAKEDAYYLRNPKTGLSQAQVDAQKALQEAADARASVGLESKIVTKSGSAGQLSTPPTEGLKTGYEWYAFNLPGGGFEWRQRPTKETLSGAYSTLFRSSGSSGSGGAGAGGGTGGGGGSSDIAKLLASQQAAAALAAQQAAAAAAEEKRRQGQSAFDLLKSQFALYGLEGLVSDVEKYVKDGLSQAEFTLRLRTESDAYKKRFAANAQRINKGLRALSEAEYITLEDQYQNVMRNYGLPASYYTKGDMGVQPGFEKFIAGDVSATELEDRIQTAQNRVINAAPEVSKALREFYPDISNGDILAYALDPDQALTNIKRKVTSAEIGAGAMQAGLSTSAARAEELQRFGVTGEQARQGFQTIGGFLPRASQLGDIYAKQGEGPFTQTTAEQEVFGTTGAVEAQRRRRKLAELETAQFSGTSGAAGGALGRERAGQF
jgi:hypothetical protein